MAEAAAVVVGTNRPRARSRLVAAQLVTLLARRGVPFWVLDLGKLDPSWLAPLSYERRPDALAGIGEKLCCCRAIVLVSPEYNGGMPGVLKYFVDLLPHPETFGQKPVWLVGVAAGRFGGLRALSQLEDVLSGLGAYVFPRKLYLAHIRSLLSAGTQITQPGLCEEMEKQLDSFLSFVELFG
jgi:chromate reductase